MRCMTEETFGPTLPVMSVADVERGDRARQRGAVRPAGLGVDPRHRARRADRAPARGRDRVRQRRAAQLRGARAADGRLEGSRAWARATAPDGIRKYTKRQSLMVTPGYAPGARSAPLPLQRAGHPDDRRHASPRSPRASCSTTRSGRRWRRSATPSSPRSSRPPATSERSGFWAAGRLAPERAGGRSRSPCCRPASTTCRSRACAGCSTRSPPTGWRRRSRRRRARRSSTRFSEASPEALAGIATLRGLAGTLFYALPDLGTGTQPELGGDRLPGRRRRRRSGASARSRSRRATGADETVEADVCVVGSGAGGGVIAGELAAAGRSVVRARDGRLPRRGRLRRATSSPPTSAPTWAAGRSRRPRARSRSSPAPALGGGTVVNWTNCLRTYDHVRAEWAGEHGLEGLDRVRTSTPPRRGLGAARRQRRVQRPERPAPAACARAASRSATTSSSITRNADRDLYAPETAAYMGFGDAVGLQALDREDLPRRRRRPTAPRSSSAPRPTRVLVEDGRAAGVRGRLDRPGGARGQRRRGGDAHGPRAVVVVACGLDRVAGAAAALRHRRPGGRRLPAPAPDGRRRRPSTTSRRTGCGARRRRRCRTSSPTRATATAS